jgi:HNH endonuclease
MPEPRGPARQRKEVPRRARGCGEYCLSQEPYSPDPFSVEHIIPLAKGGTHDLDNLAWSWQGCNSRKYVSTEALDSVTGQTVPLYHPRRDRWSAHFAWNEDDTLVIDLTPTGRATVEELQLNRAGAVNLCRILSSMDIHPPETWVVI